MILLPEARTPPGMRIYAIGDVHGQLQKLQDVHLRISEDLAARPVGDHRVVHLGDYIDRGPDSPGVVAHLIDYLANDDRRLALIGNHDLYLVEMLQGDMSKVPRWLKYGGLATCANYGVENADTETPERLRTLMSERVPPTHLAFLGREAFMLELGDYLFVHAGIMPGRPLAEQAVRDLIWMREPFLSWPTAHSHVVVHGHTATAAPEIRVNRIGIDTGAGFGGPLTCLVLEDGEDGLLGANVNEPG